jgi:hypothetical protein
VKYRNIAVCSAIEPSLFTPLEFKFAIQKHIEGRLTFRSPISEFYIAHPKCKHRNGTSDARRTLINSARHRESEWGEMRGERAPK